jgi:alpha-glucosidase
MQINEWWRGGVIYQIYPRSFQDSNSDGIGDLKGITQRLSYIASLGVDAIWISPFFKSPMKDFGYDVSDYCDIDPIFGTMQDFDNLIAEAKRLQIKVMADQVLNHSSDQHPWFIESRSSKDNPKSDWYVWADPKPDGTPPNNWLSIFGGSAWTWDAKRCQYYFHSFLDSQPDLNFHNPEVRNAVLQVVEFWLKKGLQGFRLDTVNFYFHDKNLSDNPPIQGEPLNYVPSNNPYSMQTHIYDKTRPENLDFLKDLRTILDKYPDTAALGEMGAQNSLEILGEYTKKNSRLHMVYTFYFMTENFSPNYFRKTVEKLEQHIDDGWPCWSFSNHDMVRAVSRWEKNSTYHEPLAKMLLALLTTMKGSVCMYQGEELGLTEADISFEQLQDPYGIKFWPEFKGRDGCRTPMPWSANEVYADFSQKKPWLPIPEDHKLKSVDIQNSDPSSILNHYRSFLKWRKNHPSLIQGQIQFTFSDDSVLSYTRIHESEKNKESLQVICNFTSKIQVRSIKTLIPELKNMRLLSAPGFACEINGDDLQLPAYGVCFFIDAGEQ